ncbi:UNVERIFIED_CONTAM: hypothetical protein HDU68_008854 [Siphonaria sp. JEL0065]|nr:hypothetical protein HDU68_008854 [Siphonaria sp. JEL0065]
MQIQSVLVTGGNRGIGLDAVRLLSERLPASALVFLGSRSLANAAEALDKLKQGNKTSNHSYQNIVPIQLDVTDPNSIANAVEFVKANTSTGSLDVLINNSGIAGDNSRDVLAVNVLGVRATQAAFLPIMTTSNAHFIVVASEVGAWTTNKLTQELQQKLLDVTSWKYESDAETLAEDWIKAKEGQESVYKWPEPATTFGAYGISKALVLANTRRFTIDHPEVLVNPVCPGYCATKLNGFNGFRTPAQGAESIIWPLFNDVKNGEFYRDGKVHSFNTPRPDVIPK